MREDRAREFARRPCAISRIHLRYPHRNNLLGCSDARLRGAELHSAAHHTVYPIYSHAAENWLAGRDVYDYTPGLDAYRYGPSASVLFVVLKPLGDAWGGVLWRVGGVLILAGGLVAFMRHVVPMSLTLLESALVFLLVWPLLLQNVNNGQANPHLIGLALWAVADLAQGRLWRSAAMLAAAFVIKPYILALAGLLVLIEPRLILRLIVTVGATLLLPYAVQSTAYVNQQYQSWFRHTMADDRSHGPLPQAYRDLQLLLRVYLQPIARSTYQLTEIAAGLLMAGVIATGRYLNRPPKELLTIAVTLSCCWMTVFGPASEGCTYLLLGPAAVISTILNPGYLSRSAVALLVAVCAASLFPNDYRVQTLGVHPIAGLIVLGVTIRQCLRWRNRSSFPTERRIAA